MDSCLIPPIEAFEGRLAGTSLKVIERLQQLGWKRGDTLIYQQEYALSPEHQKVFDGKKSIKPDITLTDLSGNIVAVFEKYF